ncbi:MAG: L-rhamnose mutarotase [Actinomycetales bacterium]|nr:L-rhamnose mutarotase [Actinomycetales bacterium]
MLERVTFMQWVKPEFREAYIDAHRPENLWPEVMDDTQAAGIQNYTGFIGGPGGRLVVGYFETPDLQKATKALAASKANTEWAEKINPLMETGGDISNGSMEFLSKIWRIE